MFLTKTKTQLTGSLGLSSPTRLVLVENTVTEELSHDRNHDYYNYWCLFCLVISRLWSPAFEGPLFVPEVNIHTPREDHQCYNPIVVPTMNT